MKTGTASDGGGWRRLLPIGLVVAAGAALGLWGIGWGLPGGLWPDAPPYHPDELVAYDRGLSLYGAPDATTFSWGGALFFRIAWLAAHALAVIHPLPAGMGEAARLIVALRLLNLPLAVGAALAVRAAVRPLRGERVATAAAGLLLLSPAAVVSSRFARPDTLLLFLCSLGLLGALRYLSTGDRRWAIAGGLAGGCATGAMAWGALSVTAPLAAVAAGGAAGAAASGRARFRLGLLTAGAAVLGYLFASGESLVYHRAFLDGLRRASLMHGAAGWRFPFEALGSGAWFAFGIAGAAAASAGAVRLLARPKPTSIVLLGWLAAGALLLGRIEGGFMRYLLPLAPAVAVAGAIGVSSRRSEGSRLTAVLSTAVVAATALAGLAAVWPMGAGIDPRVAAGRWFDHVPVGATVGVTQSFIGDWTYVPRFPPSHRARVVGVMLREGYEPGWALSPGLDYIVVSDYAAAYARSSEARRFLEELESGRSYRLAGRVRPPRLMPSLPELAGLAPPRDLLYLRPEFLIYRRETP